MCTSVDKHCPGIQGQYVSLVERSELPRDEDQLTAINRCKVDDLLLLDQLCDFGPRLSMAQYVINGGQSLTSTIILLVLWSTSFCKDSKPSNLRPK